MNLDDLSSQQSAYALTEGVTPEGQTMTVTKQEAEVKQYGGFISDQISMTVIDNVVVATTAIGNQAEVPWTLYREKALTPVQRAVRRDGSPTRTDSRNEADGKSNQMAVRALKVQNTAKINGHYVAIIHPDCL